ncbi:hypothetical protein ACHQM5_000124 [Ranunculus cassubicifolius]
MYDQFRAVIIDQDLFLCVLDSIRQRPHLALSFFRWAEIQPGFKRSELAICTILEILAENDLMRSAYAEMEKIVGNDLHGIVDYLSGGYVKPEASIKLLDLLLWIYTKNSMVELCLSTFNRMIEKGLSPDVRNCNRILTVLRDRDLGRKAREIYTVMSTSGIQATVVTYNILLDSFCKEGEVQEALDLREEMINRGASPTLVTCNTFVNGFSKWGRMTEAREEFTNILSRNLVPDIVSYNSLIYGYCRIGNLEEAFLLFDELRSKHLVPTVVTYNTLVDGLCRLGDLESAQALKEEMSNEVTPDLFTYTSLVNGFCKMGNLEAAKEVFEEMMNKGFQPDCVVYTTRMKGELKLGDPSNAFSLQEEMLAGGVRRSLITYNVLVDGMAKSGNLEEAYGYLQDLVADGLVPDHNMRLKDAREVFYEMLNKGLSPSVVTYTILIYGHAREGKVQMASMLFTEMQEKGVLPNVITCNALIYGLKGCSAINITYTLLIDANCNMGNWQEALLLYNQMLERDIQPDICTHKALFKRLSKDFQASASAVLNNVVLEGESTEKGKLFCYENIIFPLIITILLDNTNFL